MIIDCHTHISSPGCDFGTDEHLAGTEGEGIDACIVLAQTAQDNHQSNKVLSEYVSANNQKIFGFAVVNPAEDDISVKSWSNIKNRMGLDGAVLYCCSDGFHPSHSKAMQFYETAAELDIPLFFHNTIPFSQPGCLEYARPFLLDEIASRFSNLRIIIGGMGRPFLSQTLCMLAKHENVYADLSVFPEKVWQTYNIVISAYEAGVMDKLFFGSGLPLGKPKACIESLLGFNKLMANTDLPTVPREKIRGIIERDSLKLLGIDHQ